MSSRKSGRRRAAGICERSGVPDQGAGAHYITKREARELAKRLEGRRARGGSKPQFGRNHNVLEAVAVVPAPATAGLPPRLYRNGELARAMGVSRTFIFAMKRAGYTFTHGLQTTLESALAWRAAFPHFRARPYLGPRWRGQTRLRLNSVNQSQPT